MWEKVKVRGEEEGEAAEGAPGCHCYVVLLLGKGHLEVF